MIRKLLLVVLSFFAIIAMPAEARRGPAPLKDPPALTLPAGVSGKDVEKVIVSVAVQREWQVIDRQPGLVVLRYAPRDFSVDVTVRYDAKNLTIAYKDSTNLEYGQENGMPVIHPNYNRWVNNLAHDFESQLAVAAVK